MAKEVLIYNTISVNYIADGFCNSLEVIGKLCRNLVDHPPQGRQAANGGAHARSRPMQWPERLQPLGVPMGGDFPNTVWNVMQAVDE